LGPLKRKKKKHKKQKTKNKRKGILFLNSTVYFNIKKIRLGKSTSDIAMAMAS
jgi:hypothetical protein